MGRHFGQRKSQRGIAKSHKQIINGPIVKTCPRY